MDELRRALFDFLNTQSAAVFAVEGGKIIYTNPAAARILPDAAGSEAKALFGEELITPGAAAEGTFRGMLAMGADLGPLRLVTVTSDVLPLPGDRALVDALVSRIHSSLGVGLYRLSDVTKRVRDAGDLASIRDLASMDRSMCQVLRLARNLGRLYGGEDSQVNRGLLDLGSLVRDIVASAGSLIKEREVELEFVCQKPVELYGDRRLLEIMVMELLSNAVKYSRPGGAVAVTVGVSGNLATVKVTDSGNGDDPGRVTALRERFGVPASALDPDAGAGLGLRVARHIASLHGGTLISRTLPGGAGTTATAALPITPPDDTLLSEPEETGCTAFDILIELADIADSSAFENRDVM